MAISVIIPYRNEELLSYTVRRVHETCRTRHEVICIDDGSAVAVERPKRARHIAHKKPIGNCYSRHCGIMAARYKTVVILDAHMNFWEDDWAPKLDEWSRENPRDIGCTVSVQLRPGEMEMADSDGKYWAAHVVDMDIDSRRRRRILPVIWNKVHDVNAEVGCVLGGAYVFQKEWYIDGLMGIWQHLLGWGTSEATLSIPNWILGGRSVLLDVEIGHMYRTTHRHKVPYKTLVAAMLYNMLFLAHVVVTDDDELGMMIQHMGLSWDSDGRNAIELLKESRWPQYRALLLSRGERDWQGYKSEWMDKQRRY